MSVVLDTCAWVWMCAKPGKLSRAARQAIEEGAREGGLIVSVFSVWEVGKLVEKGKLRLSLPCREWVGDALAQPGVVLQGLTPEICLASTELPGTFHGDPADQIIVATARLAGRAIVTSDRRIRGYPHVPCVW